MQLSIFYRQYHESKLMFFCAFFFFFFFNHLDHALTIVEYNAKFFRWTVRNITLICVFPGAHCPAYIDAFVINDDAVRVQPRKFQAKPTEHATVSLYECVCAQIMRPNRVMAYAYYVMHCYVRTEVNTTGHCMPWVDVVKTGRKGR